MPLRTDTFDLGGLHLSPGEGRSLEFAVSIAPVELGGEPYTVTPELVPVRLEISKTTGGGFALKLQFEAAVEGPCMRCLEPGAPRFGIEAREVSQPGAEGEELTSPYLDEGVLDVQAWARDALALALPQQLLCREDCAGLCPVCGVDLNKAEPDHHHERGPDPRWSKLSELRFD
jgi:DUF177 domain-containing protein